MLLTPPPLHKGIVFSPQFRSHQETKMTAQSNWTIWHLWSHGKIGDCEQSKLQKLSRLLVQRINEFKINEIRQKTPQ